MIDHRTKLKTLLRELFQFDAADLDFGIYRIMNQRRAEIDDFIEHGLLDTVAQEFTLLQASIVEEKCAELDHVARQIRETYPGGIDEEGNLTLPDQFMQAELPLLYTCLQTEVEQSTVSAEAEAEIFNALYTFFSRYYDRGDFVTKRRYSRTHKYAVPYNGEEVLLHWANRDQYYVKTADVLTDYAFRIESHGGYRVCFKLAAADTEHGNVKGNKRYFLPAAEGPTSEYDEAKRELTLSFEYRPLTDAEGTAYGRTRIQEKIIEASRARLLDAVPDVTLRGLLATPPAGKDVPLLDLHLTRWTCKATSDYFIHKDLCGFLEQELDFYLKNEVMRLDDLDTENAARAEQYLTRLVVIKCIARQIIAFLAQIEEFEKALFEKPKFVLASEWCVTLDRVPQALWPQVAANDDQWAEWERLFGVQKPKEGATHLESASHLMAEHPTLTVDTALYDETFKDALLAALSERDGGLEAQRDGLLVHGENFQALMLLQPVYRGKVGCIYIDPPYNTGGDDFVYKDAFQHSSWLTMMEDRLQLAQNIMDDDAVCVTSIDENEVFRLGTALTNTFRQLIGAVIVQGNPKGRVLDKSLATSHEYLLFSAKRSDLVLAGMPKSNEEIERDYPRIDENDERYRLLELRNTHREFNRQTRPNLWYPLYVDPQTGKVSLEAFTGAVEVYPVWNDGFEGCWTWGTDLVARDAHLLEGRAVNERVKVYRKAYATTADGSSVTKKPKTIWLDKDIQTEKGQAALDVMFPDRPFRSPKAPALLEMVIALSPSQQLLVLDFFAGSGTTAQAVINLNRNSDEQRKYLLVEQSGYFDTVLKPRIQKVVYAADWKDGQPVEGSEGSSHAFQYLCLESYEDTLDNLDLEAESAPQGLFPPERDDYLLRYFLDHETHRSRLNVEKFATPFDYQLRVRRDGVETCVMVDLVETANFLLGLTVQVYRTYEHQERTYRVVFGRSEDTAGEQSVVVIWRNTADLDLGAEAAFVQEEILSPTCPPLAGEPALSSSKGIEGRHPDRIYVNGDSLIPNAQPIEEVFMQAMRRPISSTSSN